MTSAAATKRRPSASLADHRHILLVWAGWALVFLLLCQYLPARFQFTGPDFALAWTPAETTPYSQARSPYLAGPFMDGHVAWDSEYYLSIALHGYDDPAMRAIPPNFSWADPVVAAKGERPSFTSLNYAFWPAYPFAMRALALPLGLFLEPQAAATLAGVLLSLLGTLAAMLGLYRLGRGTFDRSSGRRAAFYLLVMPASMFLGMVYTEGLFLGLSFLALALGRERRFLPAGLLGATAALTKAAGAILVLPLAIWWLQSRRAPALENQRTVSWPGLVWCALPAVAYGLFALTIGPSFHLVEDRYFSRGLLAIGPTIVAWGQAISLMLANPASAAYYLVELACLAIGIASLALIRPREPALFWYGLAVLLFSLTSGVAQGMHRYVLALPSLALVPAWLGKHATFDRLWLMVNLPFMLVFLTGFVFNLWAG